MRELDKLLAEVLTDVSSDQRFNAPQNQARIQANALKLSTLAHELNRKDVISPDPDPSVIIFGELFADKAKEAYLSLKRGYRPYARELLRSIPANCIACHTRTHTGPSFTDLPLNPSIQHLEAAEKGEFFAATRQYDRALTEFNTVISDPNTEMLRPLAWTQAIKNALAIAIRVKKDPALSLKIIDRVLSAKNSPYYLKQDAINWRASIVEWSKEGEHSPATEEGLHSEAIRLLAKAHELQKYPVDRSADVLYLRASAAVHDLLQLGPNGRYTDEAYMMAGLCYDVLRSFHLGELHEIYFEACVRKSPHTILAESCYRQYQQSIYDGFTGSGGTDIPTDVNQKLKLLEALAHPIPVPAQIKAN